MIFDGKKIKTVVIVLLAVVAICALDLHCSMMRDRAERERGKPASGVISRVREEMVAGRREQAFQREDQINEQLRILRVVARRMVKAGKTKDVRRVLAAIQELEDMKLRLKEKSRPAGTKK